jgi:hypothetical protein
MATTRYTGEDIPVDITLKDDAGTVIDPNTLTGIKVYVLDSDKNIILKGAEPQTTGFNPLILSETFVRLWLESDLTVTLANKKLYFEVAIFESESDLDDGIQTTIAVSETITMKDVKIKAEVEEF